MFEEMSSKSRVNISRKIPRGAPAAQVSLTREINSRKIGDWLSLRC